MVFRSVDEVADFLENPSFEMDSPQESYLYQITYSDGTEYETKVETVDGLNDLNAQLQRLTQHMANL